MSGNVGMTGAAKLMAGFGGDTVTTTTATTTVAMAMPLNRAGRIRVGRSRSRMGRSSSRADTMARAKVTAHRRANRGQIDRCVRVGVSHRKMGQW